MKNIWKFEESKSLLQSGTSLFMESSTSNCKWLTWFMG